MLLASSQHKRLPQGLCGPFYELKQLQQGFTIGGMGPDRHFAEQQSSEPNVRFGSKADIAASPINVRFTPKSRHATGGVAFV